MKKYSKKKKISYVRWKRDKVVQNRINPVEFGWDCEDVVV